MAVFFDSSEPYINAEVGEYQELPRPVPEVGSAERNTKLSE